MQQQVLQIDLNRGYCYGQHNFSTADANIELLTCITEDQINKVYDAIKDKTYTPIAKDKLYFFPECTVPRFKVRELWKPKKVAVTIKEDNATHKFISANKETYIERSSNYYKVDNDIIKAWFKFHSPSFEKYNCSTLVYDNFSQEVKDYLDTDGITIINWSFDSILDGRNNYSFTGKDSTGAVTSYPVRDVASGLSRSYYSTTYYKVNLKDQVIASAFTDIFNGNHSDYYLDEAVNTALQADSTTIDEPMYEQLYNLLKSEDSTNTVMAMEVMANSNVAQSAKWLYKLFSSYNTKMTYESVYNSVNFKALRDTMEISRYTRFDEDSYIKCMSKFQQLDMDLVTEIRKRAVDIALTAIKNYYTNSIDNSVLKFNIPHIGVTLKGVNDGTQDIVIIDQEEEKLQEELSTHPEKYNDNIVPSSPCTNHDLMEDEEEADNYEQGDIVEMEQQVEQVEMQTSEVIEDEHYVETFDSFEEEQSDIIEMEKEEIKVPEVIKIPESVFEPIAQALKPQADDNWWENETTVSNNEDPFA